MATIVVPDSAPDWALIRERLWNFAELSERRRDACTAREIEVALPFELSASERADLVISFVKEIVNSEGCGIDIAIHRPSESGDQRNHHAHLLRTTRILSPDGFSKKLETERAGRRRRDDLVALRRRWAELVNSALERANSRERIDHRTLREQGIRRHPTFHLGPHATAIQRFGWRLGITPEVATRLDLLRAGVNAGVELDRLTYELNGIDRNLKELAIEKALIEVEKGRRDGIRRRALASIEESCEATRGNLERAVRIKAGGRFDPDRIAEACAAFRVAQRNRHIVAGIDFEVGQPALRALIMAMRMRFIPGRKKAMRKTWLGPGNVPQ
jgi:hypothetical protein